MKKEAKAAGKKITREEKQQKEAIKNEKARANAQGHGLSSGNPHQVHHTVDGAIADISDESSESGAEDAGNPVDQEKGKATIPIPVVGEGLQTVAEGFGKIGKGMFGGLRKVEKGLNNTMDTTNGYLAPNTK